MDVLTKVDLTTKSYKGRNGSILWIIIHTMEAIEGPQTAENVATYFKRVNASAHWCIDNNARVRSVLDADTAWTTPGANSRSLNFELAGYARQTAADWADEYSLAMLEIAAFTAAESAIKHNIPIRRLTDAQIAKGEKGFGGHVDFNRVFKKSSHWDPGPNFPWTYFLGRVTAHKKAIESKEEVQGVPAKPTWNNYGYTQAYIKDRQKQLNKLDYKLDEDGRLGYETVSATKKFQKKHKLNDDGIPGPLTAKKLSDELKKKESASTVNIRGIQKILGADDDNIWGQDTEKRYNALRQASKMQGVKFPYGVDYTQGVVGTKKDGVWGDNSSLAHDKKVIQLQKELARLGVYGNRVDGKWENGTDAAIKKIRSRATA